MIRHADLVDSTNDSAAQWAREGAPHGAVFVADAQRTGRGRQGRSWTSPGGGNLYASFILRPDRPPEELAGLTLAAAVAVARSLEELGAAPTIKWPNDVLLGGRKLAGVLTELHLLDEGGPVVVVGVGINLAAAPAGLACASLRELPGGPPDRDALVASLRDHLLAVSERFDAGGFEALRPAWEARWRHRGRPVMARPPGAAAVEGLALGVDAQGALLLDTGTGAPVRVTAGDVEAL